MSQNFCNVPPTESEYDGIVASTDQLKIAIAKEALAHIAVDAKELSPHIHRVASQALSDLSREDVA